MTLHERLSHSENAKLLINIDQVCKFLKFLIHIQTLRFSILNFNMWRHKSIDPPMPLVTRCHTSVIPPPSPLTCDVLYGWPLSNKKIINKQVWIAMAQNSTTLSPIRSRGCRKLKLRATPDNGQQQSQNVIPAYGDR